MSEQKTITKYDVLSPDGFSINREGLYDTPEQAEEGFVQWKRNFERQGYYSSNGGRIPLDALRAYCQILPVELTEEELKELEGN